MGLFGGRKTIVSSQAYNLLGDAEPTNWTATTLATASLAGAPSLGEYFKDALFDDAGMRIRKFIKWTNGSSGYKDKFGIVSSAFYSDYETSAEAFQPLVQEEIRSFESSIGEWDPGHYAEWWIQENHPELALKDYTVEENATQDAWQTFHTYLTITFPDEDPTKTKVFSFDEDTMDLEGLFLYVKYTTDLGTTIVYYQEHSGHPEYDVLFGSRIKQEGTYSPPIPFRIDNKFLSDYEDDTLYYLAKRAFTKAVGQNKYKSFENQIKDNDSIDDVDFAYLVLGVNLNTKTQEGKEYLFKFFQNLYENQPSGSKESSFFVSSNDNTNLSFNFIIEWDNSEHSYKSGSCVDGAKAGEYYLKTEYDYGTVMEEDGSEAGNMVPVTVVTAEHTLFCYQITDNSYEVYDYTGLNHINKVYKGKSVETSGKEALEDKDPSPFIVPLELNSWKELGLVKSNTLAQEVFQIIFNCYVSKKVRWYQSGFFQFALIVAAVVLTYFFPPLGSQALASALGTSTSVAGAIIGGTMMVIAQIAAQIGGWFGRIFQLVQVIIAIYSAYSSVAASFQASTKMLEQEVAITTTQAISSGVTPAMIEAAGISMGSSAVAFTESGMTMSTAMLENITAEVTLQNFLTAAATEHLASSAAWGFLSTAKNLLEISKPVVKGMQFYYKLAVEDYQQTLNHLQGQANELNKQIQEASKIFNSNSIVDVGTILSANYSSMESRDAFLQRTSMVGSDIVELSLAMIHNFTEMTLSTELS